MRIWKINSALKGGHRRFQHAVLLGTVAVSGKLNGRDEVIALIQEAIAFHIDGMKADGLPIPAAASLVAYMDVAA
jgi:hypothetical protein